MTRSMFVLVSVLLSLSVAVTAIVLRAGSAAASSPAETCEASKLGMGGKYDFCRLKAEAKAAKSNLSPDFSKCDAPFPGKWSAAETKANGACPTNGDATAVQSFITEHTDALATALAGGTLPEGVVTCNANLTTCQTSLSTCDASLASCLAGQSAYPSTGQTTSYGAGSDGAVQAGAAHSFTDNGDGTITDNTTHLMWEKKSADVTIHNYQDTYTWSSGSGNMDGTITTTFLAALNAGSGFAGHTDWRIPNFNELLSLADFELTGPIVFAPFNTNCTVNCTVTTCSCTAGVHYWSSTTYQVDPTKSWFVGFGVGNISADSKSAANYVRAVRGGL
jgi:hypothetical protein